MDFDKTVKATDCLQDGAVADGEDQVQTYHNIKATLEVLLDAKLPGTGVSLMHCNEVVAKSIPSLEVRRTIGDTKPLLKQAADGTLDEKGKSLLLEKLKLVEEKTNAEDMTPEFKQMCWEALKAIAAVMLKRDGKPNSFYGNLTVSIKQV